MFFAKRSTLTMLAILAFGLAFPFISRSDFTSYFNQGARLQRLADGTAVGNLSGKFFVNSSGSAEYDLPISLPPGTAKMAPSLSLHYDSSQGNGVLGMGFSLQGLTAVTRGGQNIAQNGKIEGVHFTADDRFVFNGQQLVVTSGSYGGDGSEYRTYIDSQARIYSKGAQGNGPASFIVQSKGGQTAWYGNTTDSQILAQGKNTVATWALSKIQDQAGNYISYHYNQDPANGMFYPSEIDYTGNDNAKVAPFASVKFLYENRPDPLVSYTAGSVFRTNSRLNEIQVYQGSSLVYDYHLTYELSANTYKSRLISIQACDGSGNCLRPLQFTWQTNQAGWQEVTSNTWHVPVSFTSLFYSQSEGKNIAYDNGVQFVDLYGNGHPELLVASDTSKAPLQLTDSRAWKTTSDGWTPDPAAKSPIAFATLVQNDTNGQGTDAHKEQFSPTGVLLADLKGDGHIQLLQSFELQKISTEAAANGAQAVDFQHVYDFTNQGWQKMPSNLPNNPFPKITRLDQINNIVPGFLWMTRYGYLPNIGQLAPLQGDGRLSLLAGLENNTSLSEAFLYTDNGFVATPNFNLPRSLVRTNNQVTGSSGLTLTMLSNNNLPDLLLANSQEQRAWVNTGSGWVDAPFSVPSNFRLVIDGQAGTKDGGGRVVSLLGDGQSDLIMSLGGNTHQAWVNSGAGFLPASDYNPPTDMAHGDNVHWYDDGVVFEDVTGSGLPAYLACSGSNGGNCRAWVNGELQWLPQPEYAPPTQITDNEGEDTGVRFVDLLGTGFPDIVQSSPSSNRVWLNKAQTKPDMLTNVQDALGDNLQIQYMPITNSAVYTKGTSSQYPNQDVQVPMYVVSQTASDTDVTPITLSAMAKKVSHLINSNATQHITTYHYANAVFNHLGWGFLGFGQMTTTDQYTGLSTTITYSQDVDGHTQGMPLATVTTKSDGTVINNQSSTLSTKSFGNGQLNGSWYFPYVSQTIEKGYDFGSGTPLSTKTTTTQMDDNANPTDILETDVDSTGTYSLETQNTYNDQISPSTLGQTDNLGKWWLGQLEKTVVIATNSQGSLTRTSTFSYDPNTGFLQSSTVEPGSATNELTKAYHRDAFGNITQTDITGANLLARSEKVQYDPTGSFIIAKTNALNQTTQYQVDPKFGVVTQVTDPNGLVETSNLDGFGRVTNITHPDKTQTTIQYQWASGDATAPQGSVYKVIQTQMDSPEKIAYHDELDRVIGETTQGFAGNGQSQWIWQYTAYDELGRVVGKTLPFYAGAASDHIYLTSMQYDALGRLVLTVNPDNTKTSQSYNGYVTTTTNAKNQSTTRVTNIRGNLMQVTDPEGHVTGYSYDAFNDLVSLTDSQGHVSTMHYDNFGHKLSMQDVDRGSSSYSYDALGELLSQTDAKNQTTQFTYDLLGRMIARTDASGATSTWQYDQGANAIGKLVSENGVSEISAPHQTNNLTSTTAASQAINQGSLNFETYLKDSLNRNGDDESGNSDGSNQVNINNQYKIKAASGLDKIHGAQDHLIDYQRSYAYDSLSRPVSATVSIQDHAYTTTTTYDANSRPNTVTYPNNVSIQNHYDALGYLTQVTDAKTNLAYSTINSMDANGHVTSLTRSNGLITNYTYDPATQFLTDIETNPSATLTLTQKLLPLLAPKTSSADEAKQNDKDWKLLIHAKAQHDVNSDTSGVMKVNAMFDDKTKAPLNAPSLRASVNALQSLHYDYDVIGNVNDREDAALGVQDNYQYDTLNRLTQDQTVDQTHSSATTLNYGYDEVGNITNKSDVGHYTYGENNAGPHAVTSISGLETDAFQYDTNGNQTHASMQTANGTITRDISYTSFDVPKAITQSNSQTNTSATANFYYDANRKRFMQEDDVTTPTSSGGSTTTKTTILYLDGLEIDTTIDATGKISNSYKNYIGDTELVTDDSGNTQRFDILKDNIGSTSVITDQSGNAVQRFHYDPFGEQQLVSTTSTSQASSSLRASASERGNPGIQNQRASIDPQDRTSITRYGFTGQEEVAAGGIDLIHMNGRMYDPHLGRFLSADPIIQDPSNSQCLNRYSYCNNNPIAAVDPSGFSWFSDIWHDITHAVGDLFHGIGQLFKNPLVNTLLQIAAVAIAVALPATAFSVAMFEHYATAAAFCGAVSYAETGSIGVGLKTAALTLTSEYAWAITGTKLDDVGANTVERTVTHGVVGGGLNTVEGGSFKNGFLSAAASEAFAGQISNIKIDGEKFATAMSRGVAAGVVGGTAAAISGGNFENGMITSAFGELCNAYAHEQFKALADGCNANPAICGGMLAASVAGGAMGLAGTGALLTTEAGGTTYVFWSGGDMAKDAAATWAAENGGTTLEMTPEGQSLIEKTEGMSWEEQKPFWDSASQNFANSASGPIHAFLNNPSATSIWETIEKPTLLQNGVKIIVHALEKE